MEIGTKPENIYVNVWNCPSQDPASSVVRQFKANHKQYILKTYIVLIITTVETNYIDIRNEIVMRFILYDENICKTRI